ncbi:MAG: GDP-mannose 4,6-dehydratase [bacterium]|nr:GDP-mannose 4,6-dehydratase [bacterium]
MKILITGGAGFQGSHLAESLTSQGHEVAILNTFTPQAMQNKKYLENKAEIIWGSITDAEITEKAIRGRDVVFHLGARVNVDESILHPWETIETNVRGTFNVLEAVRKNNIRMIHTSTCEVYGTPEKVPILENAELRPMSPYAASKAAADRLCFAYAQTYKVPVTIARFFNIFGERQKESNFGAVIPIFVGKAMRGETISVFGTGAQTRDYLYIADVIRAYNLLLAHPELSGEVINFGAGVGVSIKDLAEYIAKAFNAKVSYVDARPGEASDMIADNSKAKRLLGWEPQVSFYEGVDRYIAWRKAEAR